MALNIKDPDTDRLARELAAATGESITLAARRAIEERLQRVRARVSVSDDTDLRAIISRGRVRAMIDNRTPDHILGYDADGIPT